MKLSELISSFQDIQSQISSHPKLDDYLSIWLDGEEIQEFEIADIEPHRAPGCHCWYGASTEIKKRP